MKIKMKFNVYILEVISYPSHFTPSLPTLGVGDSLVNQVVHNRKEKNIMKPNS
jgi:hypothetical protein